MFVSCSSGDDGGGNSNNGPVQITLDKTQYYPFGLVRVDLSTEVTADQYSGTVGTHEVVAVRLDEATLALSLPDLPVGEYVLSLRIGNKTAEANFGVIPLPTIANPEQVIGQAQNILAEVMSAAQGAGDANYALMSELYGLMNEQIDLMTDDQRQKFAAYLQINFGVIEGDVYTRALEEEINDANAQRRRELMASNTLQWMSSFEALQASRVALATATGAAAFFPNPYTIGIAGAAAVFMITCKILSDRYGNLAINTVAIPDKIGFGDDEVIDLRAEGEPDYTFSKDEAVSFDVTVGYRSVSAEDISNPMAAQIVGAGKEYSTIWNALNELIGKIASLIPGVSPLAKDVPDISTITTPIKEEDSYSGDLTVQILSGDVGVKKVEGNKFAFSSASDDEVPFTFVLMVGSAHSSELSGLLRAGEGEAGLVLSGEWEFDSIFFDPDDNNPDRDLLHTLSLTGTGDFDYNYKEVDTKTKDVLESRDEQSGTYTVTSRTAQEVTGTFSGFFIKYYKFDPIWRDQYEVVQYPMAGFRLRYNPSGKVQLWVSTSYNTALEDAATYIFDRVEKQEE